MPLLPDTQVRRAPWAGGPGFHPVIPGWYSLDLIASADFRVLSRREAAVTRDSRSFPNLNKPRPVAALGVCRPPRGCILDTDLPARACGSGRLLVHRPLTACLCSKGNQAARGATFQATQAEPCPETGLGSADAVCPRSKAARNAPSLPPTTCGSFPPRLGLLCTPGDPRGSRQRCHVHCETTSPSPWGAVGMERLPSYSFCLSF